MENLNRKQIIENLRNKRYTFQKIGEMLGVSRQRVQQISSGYKYIYPLKERKIKLNLKSPITKIPEDWIAPIMGNKPVWEKGFGGRDCLSEKVRARDNHTCQICGKVWQKGQRRFDVHHIDEENESIFTCDNYKKFDRMITLCHRCHLRLGHLRIKFNEMNKKRPVNKKDLY